MTDGGYDVGYEASPCFWGREPGTFVKELAKRCVTLYGAHVLDAGCGEGKNAHFLASLGAHVVAIECSAAALANARALWPSDKIEWIEGDIRSQQVVEQKFDVVVAYGLTHCLNGLDEIASLIQKLKRGTKPGGRNVLCAFNSRFQDLLAHPGFTPCLLQHETYLKAYEDWDIELVSDEDLTEVHPHNNIVHTHALTRILARRPT